MLFSWESLKALSSGGELLMPRHQLTDAVIALPPPRLDSLAINARMYSKYLGNPGLFF